MHSERNWTHILYDSFQTKICRKTKSTGQKVCKYFAGRGELATNRNEENFLRIEVFQNWIVEMVVQMYKFTKTHQTVHYQLVLCGMQKCNNP